jgi:hypothetical protein
MCSEEPIATMTDSTSITIVSIFFLFNHSFFISLIQDFKIISILLTVLWCGIVCYLDLYCSALPCMISYYFVES